MKKRSLFAVFILSFVTFGIYGIVWLVKTKNEMNSQGAKIPTAWLLIVPLVNFYWLYKYAEGVEQVTSAKLSTVVAFLLQLFLGVIGNTILQSEFNKIADMTQPMAAEATVPMADSTDNAANDDMASGQMDAMPAAPTTTIAAPQPVNPTPAVPVAPVTPSAPVVDQYQANTPAPGAVASSQPAPTMPSEDNAQMPPTPNQF